MSKYRKRILHSILNYLQTKNGGAYVGYADMDNVISSETKLKYAVTLTVLIDFPKCGISKVIAKGKNIYHRSSRFMWEEQTFLVREL